MRYPNGQIALEDLWMIPDLYHLCRSMASVTPSGLYYYRQRLTSLCHQKHTIKIYEGILAAYIKIIDFVKRNAYDRYLPILATYSSGYLNALVLFPTHDWSIEKSAYAQFQYTYSEIWQAPISKAQKFKLLMLKLLGYARFKLIYIYIYRWKHPSR
jgi:hypothetical protein